MDAALKRKIETAFGSKPEELEHIYVDTNHDIRDRHIEEMFKTLFHGEPLDDIFKNNFSVYFTAMAVRLLPRNMEPDAEVYTDPDIARAWVTYNFGLISVTRADPNDPVLANDTFSHCTYVARLRTRLSGRAVHHCYAPSALYATLLTVVNVYREMAKEYHEEILNRS